MRFGAIACMAALAAVPASACKCSVPFYKNDWESAKLHAKNATAVFEGIPERFEMQWGVLNAKEGELIPADSNDAGDNFPHMLVRFRVQRVYKGDLGGEVQVRTGVGGGDCAARFAPGLTYLVYADGPSKQLGVSMCSPGGWIGSSQAAADLRYVKKELPIARDLEARAPWWDAAEFSRQQERGHQEFEAYQGRYAAATGVICGRVALENSKEAREGNIAFLSTAGSSPMDHPTAEVKLDGSFCSDRLGPGKYYVYFTRRLWGGPLRSAGYYPGVALREKAIAIEVGAGQTRNSVTFKVPALKTYSVRGLISVNDKSGLGENNVSVVLIGSDGPLWETWGHETVDFRDSFPLPKVKYFHFDDVLPGRYAACAFVDGRGWFTSKVDVTVTSHMKFIFLQLVRKK